MKKNIFKISILFILFFIVNSSYVLAKVRIIKEKIVDFNVEMNINTDSSIDITESFSINATENLKEYVVKRSFPVEYNGRKIEIKNIKVLEDSRDIIVKPVIKDRNIVTNLSDRELSVGIHTYNIKYKVKNLIEFEKDTCKINWHLCSDSFGVPINNYNIKINFPNGTQILKENIKVSDLTNDLKIEKNNISTKLDNSYVEISDNSLIYPGTDIILECEFKNDQPDRHTDMPTFVLFHTGILAGQQRLGTIHFRRSQGDIGAASLVQFCGSHFLNHSAAPDNAVMGGDFFKLPKNMGRNQHCTVLVFGDFHQHLTHDPHTISVQTIDGFIQNQQSRIAQQSHSNADTLFHAQGTVFEFVGSRSLHADNL